MPALLSWQVYQLFKYEWNTALFFILEQFRCLNNTLMSWYFFEIETTKSQSQFRKTWFSSTFYNQEVCFIMSPDNHNPNKNGTAIQRKNVVNNVDKSSLWAPWPMGLKLTMYCYKWSWLTVWEVSNNWHKHVLFLLIIKL